MLGLCLVLVEFFVFHEHDCDGQIEQEEGADDNTANEIQVDDDAGVDVFVDVHDGGPAFHGDALEYRQESCG